jgi:hypothetical protein
VLVVRDAPRVAGDRVGFWRGLSAFAQNNINCSGAKKRSYVSKAAASLSASIPD